MFFSPKLIPWFGNPGPGQIIMVSKLPSYLRTFRKRNDLTQDEMAFLLGYHSGTKVSRFERLARKPSLEAALACEVVFGIPAHQLFPHAYAEVEKMVTGRARLLSDRLEAGGRQELPRLRRKLASLNNIAGRQKVAPVN